MSSSPDSTNSGEIISPSTGSGSSAPISASKSKSNGRQPFVQNYRAAEHDMLLKAVMENEGFGANASSHIWGLILDNMRSQIEEYPRTGKTLHDHVTQMHSSIKKGINRMSTNYKLSCPHICDMGIGDDAAACEWNHYVKLLLDIMISDHKIFDSPSWWSKTVLDKLLELHICSIKKGNITQVLQNSQTIQQSEVIVKGKYAQDTKNREDASKEKKRKLDEEEQEDKDRKQKFLINEEKKTCILEQLVGAILQQPAAPPAPQAPPLVDVEARRKIDDLQHQMTQGFNGVLEAIKALQSPK